LGELAVGDLLGMQPNYSYHKNGIPYDFMIPCLNGLTRTIDVKASRTSRIYIQCINGEGKHLSLKCDAYWGVKLLRDDRENQIAEVEIHGLVSRENVLKYKQRQSPKSRAKHWNYEIPFVCLDFIPFEERLEKLIQTGQI